VERACVLARLEAERCSFSLLWRTVSSSASTASSIWRAPWPNVSGDVLTALLVARSEGYALVSATASDENGGVMV